MYRWNEQGSKKVLLDALQQSLVFSLQLNGKAKMRPSDVEGESSLSLLNVSKKPGEKAFQEALFRKRRNG